MLSTHPLEFRTLNEEVVYGNTANTAVNCIDVGTLKNLAKENVRRRVRLCSHSDLSDAVHEMLIVHDRHTYVPPHKHLGKSESIHIIEGCTDLVLFDDDGRPFRVIRMGDYASGLNFYFRMSEPVFHTLLIRSDTLVFHETTKGPLERSDTEFAIWAPSASDLTGVSRYMADLNKQLGVI